jgi:hypothetical protein
VTSLAVAVAIGQGASAPLPTLGTFTAANQNTTVTNSMGPDGYTWANAPSIQDTHGNIIAISEDNSAVHHFTYLNSGGAWADAAMSEGFLTRGSMWLDTTNNLLHVLWSTSVANGGIVYRRYVVSYSGNNISGIVSDNGVSVGGSTTQTNVVLDDGSGLAVVEHPVLIGLPDIGGTYGAFLAVWGACSASGGEVRAAMCVLGASVNAAKTLANWVAPVTASTSALGANTTPATGSYSTLATGTSAVDPPYLGIARQANGNLFLVYWNGTAYRWRRATWNAGASNWSSGLSTAVTIYNATRAGTDAGYGTKALEGIKPQLITAPSEDAGGNMIVGLASWKDNTAGDTWGIARIDTTGALTTVDVYSWGGASNNGAPNLYPTGDAMVDPQTGYILATYITQTDARAQAFTPSLAASGSSRQIFAVVSDIPLLLRFRVAGGTRIGVLQRDAVNTPTPPYHGRYASALFG